MNEKSEEYVPDEDLDVRTRDEPRAKPDISRWEPAIVDGEFVVPTNEYLVIEHVAVCLDRRWLDTRVYIVTRIDAASGDLHLYDPVRQQQALSNYKTGPGLGLDFRVPPPRRNPETLFTGKRPKKKKPKPVPVEGGDGKPKKHRGRPKGSKNRPKSVIEAEKRERAVRSASRRKRKNGKG